MPLTDTTVRLLTHTVDMTVRVDGNQTVLDVRAVYRLHNTNAESQTVLLQVVALATPTNQPLPTAPSLVVDGQILPLQPTDTGYPQTTQITLTPDSRRSVTLSYQTQMTSSELGSVRYAPQVLDAWAGRPESWRVTLQLPGEGSGLIPAESWVSTSPDGWTYNGRQLQWLREGAFPEQPFSLQWITPTLWQTLVETRQFLSTQPSIERFLLLGDLYNRLYRSPQIGDSARQRFYAQALAAYVDGATYAQQIGLPAADGAPLHQALAALYRSRSVRGDGQLDSAYVDLMVEEIQKTLAVLPLEDNRRGELIQWLTQGLEAQFQHAQRQSDWTAAAQVLDQMVDLPAVDPAWIASERQRIELQQALTLLDQDNQDAAIALVGADVLDESLLPPPENRAIFAAWQVTVTLHAQGSTLLFTTSAQDGRTDTAQLVTDQLIQAWQNAGVNGASVSGLTDNQLLIELSAEALDQHRLALVQAIPPLVDWALLRTLIATLDPAVTQNNQWIWQRIEISQRVDLRPVSDQWRGVAALLERQASEIALTSNSAQTQAAQTQSVEAVQSEVREQLRQIYIEREAKIWQNAVRNTSVRVQIQIEPQDPPNRVWIVQLGDAPQDLTFQTEVISSTRLLFSGLALLIGVLLVAALLWLLL